MIIKKFYSPAIKRLHISLYAGLHNSKEVQKEIEYEISHSGRRVYPFFINENLYNLTLKKDYALYKILKAKEDSLLKLYDEQKQSADLTMIDSAFSCYQLLENSENRDTTYIMKVIRYMTDKYLFPNWNDLYAGAWNYYTIFSYVTFNDKKSITELAFTKGKIIPFQYASIVDRNFSFNSKSGKLENRYGTILKKKDNIIMPEDIYEIEQIDKRRWEIGLMPLWKDAKIKRYDLPEDYKKYLRGNGVKFD